MILEFEPSNEKQAPTSPLIRDQHVERKTWKHLTDKVGTNKESTEATMDPTSSHLDNKEN